MNLPQELLPGDVLLCQGFDIVRKIINSDVGHVKLFLGNGVVITSKPNHGVDYYPLGDLTDVVHVLRTEGIFDHKSLVEGMTPFIGKPYGWSDDFMDINIHLGNAFGSMNCSHTCVLALRYANIDVVASYFDLREFTPRDFLLLKGFQKLL